MDFRLSVSPVVDNLLYLRTGTEILYPVEPVRLFEPYGAIFAFAGIRVGVPRDYEAAAVAQIRMEIPDRLIDLSRIKISQVKDIAGSNRRHPILSLIHI